MNQIPTNNSIKDSMMTGPYQYSLATLFLLVAAIGVVIAEAMVLPSWAAGFLGLSASFALPGFLAVGLLSCRRKGRVFCLGAVFPALALLIAISSSMGNAYRGIGQGTIDPTLLKRSLEIFGNNYRGLVAAAMLHSVLVGFLCIGLCRILEHRRKST
jgi:hypothetical protein